MKEKETKTMRSLLPSPGRGWGWASYLRFLSRNKVYTAINVFGLSVSLMFVMLIGVYVRDADWRVCVAGVSGDARYS